MDEYISTLKNGGIGIIATDTLFGIVGQALNRSTVERIYNVKKRTPTKPFIILISSVDDLDKFGVNISRLNNQVFSSSWPGPVSIILECNDTNMEYLHRGTNTLAFRLPAKQELVELIKQTGPLVAPSANPEGLEPAQTITEARNYFGKNVDFCQDGIVSSTPSKIIKITDLGVEVIRP